MKLGFIGRAWLGFQAVRFAKTVVDERKAYRERMSRFHGYTWSQVEHILSQCGQAVPDLHDWLKQQSEDNLIKATGTILTCHPAKFRERFGFDRPPPG